MTYTYEYPRPSVTVDCVIFGLNFDTNNLEILMIRRGGEPYKGCLALPGGFVNMDESLETAARRELMEETGVSVSYLEQLYTMGEPNRDPRCRVIGVSYFGLVKSCEHKAVGGDDATDAFWMPVKGVMDSGSILAFDHKTIIGIALKRLQDKIKYAPIGFNLLTETFTLDQLCRLYESILGRSVDKRNFYKKILSMNILSECGKEENVNHRPAKLYKFDVVAYTNAVANGFNFNI